MLNEQTDVDRSDEPEGSHFDGGSNSRVGHSPTTDEKLDQLRGLLLGLGGAVVAFSGGVDSTFLLKVAVDVLGERALAVTADSPTYPAAEFEEAKRLAVELGARHRIVLSAELDNEDFVRNDPNRCYYCKCELFKDLSEISREEGLEWVLDGSTADDLTDYRPGRQAAAELGVRSPLLEVGLGKEEIRQLSRRFDLSTADKPSFACLSSRFPYGTAITPERLERVGAAEDLMRELGFVQFRVRHHGEIARIELDEQGLGRVLRASLRDRITTRLKELGYRYVTIDLQGYRSGSLNEGLVGDDS